MLYIYMYLYCQLLLVYICTVVIASANLEIKPVMLGWEASALTSKHTNCVILVDRVDVRVW